MEQMERVSAILKPMKAPGSPSQSLLELSLADGSGSNVLVFVGVCVVLPLMLGVFFFIIYCYDEDMPPEKPYAPPRQSRKPPSDERSKVPSMIKDHLDDNASDKGVGKFGQARKDRVPSEASAESQDSSVFCSALVVHVPDGVTLMIEGDLRPDQQEGTVQVSKVDSAHGIVFQGVISEKGKDPGILLETGLHAHIAFLDTSQVADRHVPRVAVHRAFQSRFSTVDQPFVYVEADKQNGQYVVRSASTGKNYTVLTIHPNRDTMALSIINPEGKQVAATQWVGGSAAAVRSGRGSGKIQLNIKVGADAGLILCAVLAVNKLPAL